MQGERQKVIVAGGGITGLAAAYYLKKEAKEKGLALDVKLIEASHRLGGKIQTIIRDGFVIERGPDSFLVRKQSAARLAREAGLEKELVKLDKEVERVQKKLGNEGFIKKAPEKVIEEERAKEKDYIEKRDAVRTRIAELKG